MKAQSSYNRWESTPAITPKPLATAAQRGAKIMKAEIQRDSLRIVVAANGMPLLQRGIKQRLQENRPLPSDSNYYDYLRKSIRYPIQALQAQIQGRITMRLAINAAGQVSSLSEVENTIPLGSPGRDEMVWQVEVALRQLRFEPGGNTTEELTINYSFL